MQTKKQHTHGKGATLLDLCDDDDDVHCVVRSGDGGVVGDAPIGVPRRHSVPAPVQGACSSLDVPFFPQKKGTQDPSHHLSHYTCLLVHRCVFVCVHACIYSCVYFPLIYSL